MAKKFSKLEKTFELAPEGVHTATCIQWVDRGLQESQYGPNEQYSFKFELLGVQTETGEPFIIFYTVLNTSLTSRRSEHSKRFHELCNALMNMEVRGTEMTCKDLVGKSCRVNIVHVQSDDGLQTFANIMSFKPLPRGTVVEPAKTPLLSFSLDPNDVPDKATLDANIQKLSQSERDKVMKSISYTDLLIDLRQKQNGGKKLPVRDIINDNIPGEDGYIPWDEKIASILPPKFDDFPPDNAA